MGKSVGEGVVGAKTGNGIDVKFCGTVTCTC